MNPSTSTHEINNLPKPTPPDDKIPGNIAVWILIYAELTEFALFFIIFLFARAANLELFSQGPAQLHTSSGALNTLILLTSSFFVARAIQAIKADNLKVCQHWLWLTLLAGATYIGIKIMEYNINAENGINSTTNLFFTIYYYLTFNHLLHVLMGMCSISWVLARSYLFPYSKDDHEGLESAACYWHMIDIVWIIILTLISIIVAEDTPENTSSIVVVCFIVTIKGQLIIDRLIGLRLQNQKIRWVMLSYFYLLPILFIVGIIHPELLQF